jgi:hypothetical protein
MQSLFEGMDAFATSAATGGKEGGVEEIQKLNAQKQDMALKQKAAGNEQQDHEMRMKMGTADYNMKTAQLAQLIAEAPLKRQELYNKVQGETLALLLAKHVPLVKAVDMLEGQNTQDHVAAVGQAASGDLASNHVIPTYGPDGAGKPGGKSVVVSDSSTNAIRYNAADLTPSLNAIQNTISNAKQELGGDNRGITVAQGQLDSLKKGLESGGTISHRDWLALNSTMQLNVEQQVAQKEKVTEFQQKQAAAKSAAQAADPLFKMENEPGEMSGEKSAAAIPLLQNKLSDPATPPADKVRATRLLAQATAAHSLFQQDQLQKANAEQQAKQGDPKQAGAMLAAGSLTLGDMKTRGMTPKFIMDATKAAQGVDPKYNPADEINAEAVAKSPTQNQFFGSANSLISKNGTLDQVVDAGSKLPNHTFPIFNKLADAQNYATGHPEVAAYMQTALGAADDYAKVLGGGTGTEGMQMHILNAMTASQNQNQRTAVVNAMRGAVNSQVESRIGKNKFLMRQYGYALPGNQPAATPFNPKTDFKPIAPQAAQ